MDLYLEIDTVATIKVKTYQGTIADTMPAGEVMKMSYDLEERLKAVIAEALSTWSLKDIKVESQWDWKQHKDALIATE